MNAPHPPHLGLVLLLGTLTMCTVVGCGGSGGASSSTQGSGRSALSSFHAYLGALGAGNYPTACGYLSANVRHSLSRLARGKSGGTGCARILPALLAPGAATTARQQAEGAVAKVRVKEGEAFVIFHAPGAKLYELTMVREGGTWRAATVAASVLVPSATALGR